MNITFGDKKLKKAAEDERRCYKELDQPYRLVFRPHEDPIPTTTAI